MYIHSMMMFITTLRQDEFSMLGEVHVNVKVIEKSIFRGLLMA